MKKKTQNSLPDCDFENPEYRARAGAGKFI